MTDLIALKAEARKLAKQRRKAAKAASPEAPEKIRDHFLSQINFGPNDIVSAYRPIYSELDPSILLAALHENGLQLCMPVIDGPNMPLSFARWEPTMPMTEGAFGAEIPEVIEKVIPTLLLVPLLSFDLKGYRLGYGGGFYDRTLERLRSMAPTRAYGLAYAAQQVDKVPIETTDQVLDGILTEAGLIEIEP